MTTKTLKFECPSLTGSLLISPYAVHSTRGVDTGVTMAAEDDTDHAVVALDRVSTVSAALHMIACALGEVAALDAERAIAPHMKVSKP